LERDSVGQIDLPATLEAVNVHDDFSRTGGQLGRLAERNFCGSDARQLKDFIADNQVQSNFGRVTR
jgi:hypothetical protein